VAQIARDPARAPLDELDGPPLGCVVAEATSACCGLPRFSVIRNRTSTRFATTQRSLMRPMKLGVTVLYSGSPAGLSATRLGEAWHSDLSIIRLPLAAWNRICATTTCRPPTGAVLCTVSSHTCTGSVGSEPSPGIVLFVLTSM
jgi:hypothetical protein